MSRLVFTLGEALAVFLARGNGPLERATEFDLIVSGAEVNVAVGLVQEGHRATIVSRVGADSLGGAVVGRLIDWGVDARVARDTARSTGTLVRTTGGGDRGEAVHLRRGAAAEGIAPEDVEHAWSDDVAAVFVTGITMVRSESAARAAVRTVALAREAGALVVVDPNLRPALGDRVTFAQALSPLRGRIDIAIGDPDELAALAGTDKDVAATLIADGCQVVVTKLGADGAMLTDAAGGEYRVGSLVGPDDIVDTIGAGDAFTAGLLAALLDREPPAAALERAARRAAVVVRTRGDVATAGVPR